MRVLKLNRDGLHASTRGRWFNIPPDRKWKESVALAVVVYFFSISLINSTANGPHSILPVVTITITKDLPISPLLSPVHALRFFIAMQVQHSYNSSTNGWILLTHVLTLSATEERKKTNPALTRIELATSALAGVHVTYQTTRATRANWSRRKGANERLQVSVLS